MKLTRVCFLLLVVSVGVGTVKADSIPVDPDMIVTDAGGCGSIGVTSTFSFNANAAGGGGAVCPNPFRNDSGSTFTALTISTHFLPSGPCAPPSLFFSPLFHSASCSFNSDTQMATITFSGIGFFDTGDGSQFFSGITPGMEFAISLGRTGWEPNGLFNGVASVPEPATMLLLAIGLAGFGFLHRRQTIARQAS